MKVNAYAALEAGGKLVSYSYEVPDDLPDDFVEVKVSHCGLCYSDVGCVSGRMPGVKFPLVCGHEAVGVVTAVGKAVPKVKVGARVGCHSVRSCCGACENCKRGYNIMCDRHDFLVTSGGGFGEVVRMSHSFVFALPEQLPSEYAAPLMCAGSTMWNALRDAKAKAGDRVAILGIGGLGHLGVKFAAAWGCNTAAISTSAAKEADAKSWGAAHYINLNDPASLQKYMGYFDSVIVTSPKEVDFMPLLGLLRFKGTIALAGIPSQTITLPVMPMLHKAATLVTVAGCPREEYVTMLEFVATRPNTWPVIEKLPFDRINEAFDKVHAGTPKYRMVLTR